MTVFEAVVLYRVLKMAGTGTVAPQRKPRSDRGTKRTPNRHETVNHSAGEYARGAASTNSIESVWAVLKRGLHGVYHHASKKHLFRYVDEFTFRLNEGNVERHTLERLDSFVDGVSGKRLTYARLIA